MAQAERFKDLPAIETERLLLRTLKMEDAEDIFEWVSDPQVTTYLLLAGTPIDRGQQGLYCVGNSR